MLELLLALVILSLLPAILSVLAFLLTLIGLGSYHLARSALLAAIVVGLPIAFMSFATSAPTQLAALFAGFWLVGRVWAAIDPSSEGENK